MRIWFNHWFSTAYHLINMMRNNDRELYFIGSSTNHYAVYKNVCDEWYDEESLVTEYTDFCLDFCRRNNVDVFVPRRGLADIIRNRSCFDDIGVKVFSHDNADIIEILDDKQKTYEHFRKIYPEIVPDTYTAHSFEEFCEGFEKLRPLCGRVCYKLVIDEGARSFRVIDDSINSLSGILNRPGSKLTYSAAKQIMHSYDFENPVLLMPYLSGVEISVDCLADKPKNLIIPRYKLGNRYSEVIFDKEIMDKCDRIINMLEIKMPLNIQFKTEQDKIYLLEINPRMSGGLQISCKASGINIPYIALNQLTGKHIEWKYPDFHSKKTANIETPTVIE